MKIGIIQPRISYYSGGGEKTQVEYSRHLALLGHSVTIYTLKSLYPDISHFYRDLQKENLSNLKIKEFDVPDKYRYIFDQEAGEDRNRWDSESLLFNQLIFNTLQEDNPDIIFSCYILDGIFRPINIPGILHLSGYPVDKLEIRKSFLSFFDATISISNNVKEKWSEYLNESKNNYVINKGVDLIDGNGQIVSKYEKNIVFAGRLIERKGVVTLLESMKNLVKNYPDLHLWILGNGPQRDQLVQIINENVLSNNVDMVGQTDQVFGYYRMADICVFPSYEKEGLMGTVLEAMSVGKPVVTTTNNGNEDVISNGVNGILVEPRSGQQLTDAIERLLKDPVLSKKIGIEAGEYVKKNLTWEKSTAKLINVFNRIIK